MKIPERLETKRILLSPYPKEDVSKFLDSYRFMDPGFSLLMSNKLNDNYLGICGLKPISESSSVGCVYALLSEFRGNGFAIEAMLKLIEYAFNMLEIPHIIAYIHPENSKGWKVAERIGMKYMGQIKHKCFVHKTMLFTLDKKEYMIQHSY